MTRCTYCVSLLCILNQSIFHVQCLWRVLVPFSNVAQYDKAIKFAGRSDLEAVITSILDSIFYSKRAEPGLSSNQDIIEIFLNAATFSKDVEGCNEYRMSFGDFKSWCSLLPSVRKFLGNMMMPPGPGFFSSFCSV